MFDFELFLSAFAVLFVVVDPPGCAPIFATLTEGTSRSHQREMATKSTAVALVILVLFAYAGEFVFNKLGLSLDALRIAGGIMLFVIGLNMVFEKRTKSRDDRADDALHEVKDPDDVSVFPMGIPMIAGPGTMASLLLQMSEVNTFADHISVLSALVAVLLFTFVTLLVSTRLMELLGKTVTNIVTRVLGILLATLAAQFIIDGIKNALF